jgi:hypothetical protein
MQKLRLSAGLSEKAARKRTLFNLEMVTAIVPALIGMRISHTVLRDFHGLDSAGLTELPLGTSVKAAAINGVADAI